MTLSGLELRKAAREYVIFASGGNDSVALVQYAHEAGLQNVAVAYSNTGWAATWWPLRIERFKAWVNSLGYEFHEIPSEGMESLIDWKKAFPANGMQYGIEAEASAVVARPDRSRKRRRVHGRRSTRGV